MKNKKASSTNCHNIGLQPESPNSNLSNLADSDETIESSFEFKRAITDSLLEKDSD